LEHKGDLSYFKKWAILPAMKSNIGKRRLQQSAASKPKSLHLSLRFSKLWNRFNQRNFPESFQTVRLPSHPLAIHPQQDAFRIAHDSKRFINPCRLRLSGAKQSYLKLSAFDRFDIFDSPVAFEDLLSQFSDSESNVDSQLKDL
jgi:hypothetical protein